MTAFAPPFAIGQGPPSNADMSSFLSRLADPATTAPATAATLAAPSTAAGKTASTATSETVSKATIATPTTTASSIAAALGKTASAAGSTTTSSAQSPTTFSTERSTSTFPVLGTPPSSPSSTSQLATDAQTRHDQALSPGTIAAAVLVPLLALSSLAIFFFWLLFKRGNDKTRASTLEKQAGHAFEDQTELLVPPSALLRFSSAGQSITTTLYSSNASVREAEPATHVRSGSVARVSGGSRPASTLIAPFPDPGWEARDGW